MAILEAQQLNYSVSGKRILENLSFEIEEGSLTVVVGENGAGKSTLLKLLMGFAKPSSGNLLVMGHRPSLDPYLDRNQIAFLSENLSPPIDWSVAQFLSFNRWFYPTYSLEMEKRLMAQLQMDPKSRIGQLSMGETRRIQIVAALSYHPKLIIIDEFTAVLDIVGRSKFMSILKERMHEQQATIVMATNIIDDVELYASHLLVLHEGRSVWHSTKGTLKEESHKATLTEAIAALIEKAESR